MVADESRERSVEDISDEIARLTGELKIVRGLYNQCCLDLVHLRKYYRRNVVSIVAKAVILIVVVSLVTHWVFYGLIHGGI